MQAIDLTGEPFYIPATDAELAGKSVEFRFRLRLYYVGLVVTEVIEKHYQQHKELPPIEKVRMPVEGIRLARPSFVIEVFAAESSSYWPSIKAKNRSFFLNNAAAIFGPVLPKENKDALAIIFQRGLISAEQEEKIWTLLLLLIKLAIKYMYKNLVGDKIVVHRIFGDGQPNPKAPAFTREQLSALIKEYNVDMSK